MIFYLGIDAGGTFTRCSLYDEQGLLVDTKQFESMHFMRVGFDGMTRILREVDEAFASYMEGNMMHVTIGTAGYGQDETVRKQIEQAIYPVFPQATIMNDAQLAMISALENEDGIFVISGTGSIAFQMKEDITYRRGGWGYLLDDEGSAFDIGQQVLKCFIQMADLRIEKTSLFKHIMETLKLAHPHELIAYMSNNKEDQRQCVAQFAKMIFPCATQGDSVAIKIYEEAGKKLALLVRSFDILNQKVSYGGSVLLNNHYVRDAFIKELAGDFEVIEPLHLPEYTAYLIHQ